MQLLETDHGKYNIELVNGVKTTMHQVAQYFHQLSQENPQELDRFAKACYKCIFPAKLHRWYLELFWGINFKFSSWALDSGSPEMSKNFEEFPIVSTIAGENMRKAVANTLGLCFQKAHAHTAPDPGLLLRSLYHVTKQQQHFQGRIYRNSRFGTL